MDTICLSKNDDQLNNQILKKRYIANDNKIDLRLGDFKNVLREINNIDLWVGSPPYNIGTSGPKKVFGLRKEGIYDSKNFGGIDGYFDKKPEQEYQKEQIIMFDFFKTRTKDNAFFIYNHKDRHVKNRLICPEKWLFQIEEELNFFIHDKIVWNRMNNTHNHEKTFYDPVTEYVYILKKNLTAHQSRMPQKSTPTLKTTCWNINKVYQKEDELKHSAPFPIEIPLTIIRDFCQENDLVCDPYSGSGTTMLAAYKCGCRFIGAELEEKYFNLAIRRFELETGIKGRIINE